ncbi:hypothetical protein B0H13DRAFT_1994027, partial [Mycena leptocephala]
HHDRTPTSSLSAATAPPQPPSSRASKKPQSPVSPVRPYPHCQRQTHCRRPPCALPAHPLPLLSVGAVPLKGLDINEEGVDRQMAALYYSKWMFIEGLLPALRAAHGAARAGPWTTLGS